VLLHLLALRVQKGARTDITSIPIMPLLAGSVSGRVEDRSAFDGVEAEHESL
jgi:hypothetical protein